MRQIGNLPDMEQALTLADYLLSLQIETRLENEPDGRWAIWVCDEDHMAQARDELAAFQNAPHDPRFVDVAKAERARRQANPGQEEEEEPESPAKPSEPARRLRPVTLIVGLLTIVVGLLTLWDSDHLRDRLTSVPSELRLTASENDPTLPEIRQGQLWRLVAPSLVHLSAAYWIFYLFWFQDLGSQIEGRRGSVRLLLLVIVLSVISNLAQFYLGHPLLENGWLHLAFSSHFGGLSGVVYGLFGYVWIKERYEPDLGLVMPRWLSFVLVFWLILCFTPLVETHLGPVGNAAHVTGFLAGVGIGAVPILWRRLRNR